MNRFEKLKTSSIVFHERPDSIPYNYRISYRVAIIALIISICSPRKGCSLVKLQVINDALSNKDLIGEIKHVLECKISNVVVQFDSSLNRALNYAIADGLIIQQDNKAFRLSKSGRTFVKALMEDEGLLCNEKERLIDINSNLDETTLSKILERWSITNDTN